MPTYAGLLSFDVSLLLHMATKSMPNIFGDMYIGISFK